MNTINRVESLLTEAMDLLRDLRERTMQPRNITTNVPLQEDNYRTIHWNGQHWHFTPMERAAVQSLWEAWERGRPDVHASAILRFVASKSDFEMDVVEDERSLFSFLNGNSNLIVSTRQGMYRLAFADVSEGKVAA